MQLDEIPYQVSINKRAKRVGLRINAKGLTIVTPRKLPEDFIQDLLIRHQEWIAKNLPAPRPSEFPEVISILDHPYELIYIKTESITKLEIQQDLPTGDWEITKISNSYVCVSETQIAVYSASQDIARQSLHKWLAGNAKEVLIDRTIKLAREFGFEFKDVAVKDQITRWGSCSSQKNLNFNWRLVLAPARVMQYVIIHELAHTKQMNHSAKFWAEVSRCMPDYKTYRAWLKQHTNELREI